MIGLALSAITLGFSAGNGEKIAIPDLLRQRLDGCRVVRERLPGLKSGFFSCHKAREMPCGQRTTHRHGTYADARNEKTSNFFEVSMPYGTFPDVAGF